MKKSSAPPSGRPPAVPATPNSHPSFQQSSSSPAMLAKSVDVAFAPNQPVGINFRWRDDFFHVDGFTADSPAARTNRIFVGYKLVALNGVSLRGCSQDVVIKMMKQCTGQDRKLTFSAAMDLSATTLLTPSSLAPVSPLLLNVGSPFPPSAAVSTSFSAAAAASAPRPSSHQDSKSTPARRRRIVYDFAREVWKSYRLLALPLALSSLRRISSAVVLQCFARSHLARSRLRLLRASRLLSACLSVQRVARGRAARLRARRLKRDKRAERRRRAAVVLQASWRRVRARRFLRRVAKSKAELVVGIREAAARRIQSAARGRPWRLVLLRARVAAARIQALARGRRDRLRAREERLLGSSAAVVQKHSRRLAAGKIAGRRRWAVGMMQGFARRWINCREARYVVDELRKEREKKEEAAAELRRQLMLEKEKEDELLAAAEKEAEAAAAALSLEVEVESSEAAVLSPLGTPQSARSFSISAEQSPEQLAWQLRYDPDTGTSLQKGELFKFVDSSPSADLRRPDVPQSPKPSPHVDQETKFRREREARENVAKEAVAKRLQAYVRGASLRRKVDAMKRVVVAIEKTVEHLKRVKECRVERQLLVRRRKDAAVVIQSMARTASAKAAAQRLRDKRLQLCLEIFETEFAPFDFDFRSTLVAGNKAGIPTSAPEYCGDHVFLVDGECGLNNGFDRRWLKLLPDNAQPPFGCSLFRGLDPDTVVQDMEGVPFLQLRFEEPRK